MIEDADLERFAQVLPILRSAPPEVIHVLRNSCYVARIPAGRDVFTEGDGVGAIPLLVSGTVRVYQLGETGREVTLYRFRPGESCVLTANAILTEQTFPAIATVEEDAEAVMIPADLFRKWVASEEVWRRFFVQLVAQRLASVMTVVDEVAFRRLDQRVAALIAERVGSGNPIRITHQEVAAELGSAREAVSRVLEDLAVKGWIEAGRGRIRVLDLAALRNAASG